MKIMMQNARVAFAHGLFKASAMQEGQTPKYGADFIIEADTKCFEMAPEGKKPIAIKDALIRVANEAWKGKGAEVLADLESSKKCLRNGDKRIDKAGNVRDGYAGNWYVTAKTPTKPTLLDRGRRPVEEGDGVIYSGCYVNVIFDVYANTKPQYKGVFAGLTGVQFSKDGDSFGGGAPAKATDFDDLGGEDDSDPFS